VGFHPQLSATAAIAAILMTVPLLRLGNHATKKPNLQKPLSLHCPTRQRREGFIFRVLLRFFVVDVARLPHYQGGIKGILANPTTKVLHGVAYSGRKLCTIED